MFVDRIWDGEREYCRGEAGEGLEGVHLFPIQNSYIYSSI